MLMECEDLQNDRSKLFVKIKECCCKFGDMNPQQKCIYLNVLEGMGYLMWDKLFKMVLI